ncbi:MAG TPA: molybdopterin cofactor-binding domain-containing protein, partial [Spirochaetia bacterium]|nr:molybdopterin cofactor-binding domain-containing protein [Spirochaetia bacterium]
GSECFTDDLRVSDPLHGTLLYSPHAHAEIVDIDTRDALEMEGVRIVLTFMNVPRIWHTTAGQGYPEPSPYDALLFDHRVRFVGDRVAFVAAETRETAAEACARINVTYSPLPPLFDPEKAMEDSAPRLHGPEAFAKIPVKYETERNLAAEVIIGFGNLDRGFQEADIIFEETYRTHYASHCAIEPHAVTARFDELGRLVIVTTTQVPFHARRITSQVTGIPLRMLRVIKPRIGGGFGGKQEVFLEPLAALAAWRTGRAVKIVLSRREVFVSSRTRHPMRTRLKIGAKEDGRITALEMDCLMNSGAYGTHALTVLSNAGAKVLPLFNRIENLGFRGRSVYTNLPVGGAYRGYGATQGYFAFNQHIDMIARRINKDPISFCKSQHIREGETSEVFKALGEGKEGVAQIIKSCKLDACMDRGADEIGWYAKRDRRIREGRNKVRGVGMAIAMQGSGIPKIDMGSASMKMNEDGSFNLLVGATDLGTGSDTVLAQIASETLGVPVDHILVLSSDTDLTPFDVGAYASSTTYISGAAVQKCAGLIADQIRNVAARILEAEDSDLILGRGKVTCPAKNREVSLEEIALFALYAQDQFQIQAQASHTSPESPPPFMAQFAEVLVDLETGRVDVVQFVTAVDCGQPINPRLVEGQVEGAVVNGISYTLCEEYLFDSGGRMTNPGFWDYKIYTAPDIPRIVTLVIDSYEETGPFGAKSVGEIAINGPAPAIANAIFDAAGIRLTSLPITPEKVWRKLKEERKI